MPSCSAWRGPELAEFGEGCRVPLSPPVNSRSADCSAIISPRDTSASVRLWHNPVALAIGQPVRLLG